MHLSSLRITGKQIRSLYFTPTFLAPGTLRTLCTPGTATTMTATDCEWNSPREAAAVSGEEDQEEREEEEEGGDLQLGGASTG